MSEQEMAVALEQLRGEVAKNNKASELGFAQLTQQINGLIRTYKEQDGRCRSCEAGLRAEISASEQRALAREAALAARLDKVIEKVDARLRSLEISRGWLNGLIGLGGALVGALMPIVAQWLRG